MIDTISKSIYFSGDSFTYGEGLDLFTPNEKWKKELYHLNDYHHLQPKVDAQSDRFRQENNFPGLIQKEFPNYKINQKTFNGGSLTYNLEKENFNNYDILIFQFTCFSRNDFHFKHNCKCEKCKPFPFLKFSDFINVLDDIHRNDDYNQKLANYLKELLDYDDLTNPVVFEKLDLLFKKMSKEHLEIFKKNYLIPFEKMGKQVYFIDSWEKTTSEIIHEDDFFKDRMIPLIANDESLYTTWFDWIHTFKTPYIDEIYPQTKNHHPTLETHKIIAKSIIKFLKNK